MRLTRFSYENKRSEWCLAPLELVGDFTLLVGASGAGKTRILRALLDLKRIAMGESLDGVSWSVAFYLDGIEVLWSGRFAYSGSTYVSEDPEANDEVALLEERVVHGGTEVVKREPGRLEYMGSVLPVQLTATKSVLALLETEPLHGLARAFKLQLTAAGLNLDDRFQTYLLQLLTQCHSAADIRALSWNGQAVGTLTKLALAYEKAPELFAEIAEDFIAVFPSIEEIEVKHRVEAQITVAPQGSSQPAVRVLLRFRHRGVNRWLAQAEMSSGMLKTLSIIANFHLCPDQSVVLIDEFENSLGVNCIEILDDLRPSRRGVQYIITSHHPYIINNVPIASWKIVVWDKGKVSALDPKTFHLGESKHEAFMQLLQLDEFNKGTCAS